MAGPGGVRFDGVGLDLPDGRRLLEGVEMWAREAGAREMVLHVFVGNGGARGFYAGLGYREVEWVRGFYGAGLDAVVCRKAV